MRHHFRQMADSEHVDALDHRRFGRIFQRQDQVFDLLVARAYGDGQRAAHGTDGAIER